MRLLRIVALPLVVLFLNMEPLNCQVATDSSDNELSVDGTCSAEKESCGCDKTSRTDGDVSKIVDETTQSDSLVGDSSSSSPSSSATLHRPADVEFPRKNQMVLIKGKFLTFDIPLTTSIGINSAQQSLSSTQWEESRQFVSGTFCAFFFPNTLWLYET